MIKDFDVFNGDADGLCGITQLRLAQPQRTRPITGVKRNNTLLKKVAFSESSHITVVDISLHPNLVPLKKALKIGCTVQWYDHHHAGDIPSHPNLVANIDTSPDVCSSLIINDMLKGRFKNWAIAAAFGDNLVTSAHSLAKLHQTPTSTVEQLQELGTSINYNSYGESTGDLHYHPEDLYRLMLQFEDPLAFIAETGVLQTLKSHYEEDLTHARGTAIKSINRDVKLLVLPNERWARRINGLFANHLANNFPSAAHLILIEKNEGYSVSIRAPKNNPINAHHVALQFENGGGRHTAAGIQNLKKSQLDLLIEKMNHHYHRP